MPSRQSTKTMKPSVPKPEPESIDQLIANVIRPVVRGWQSYHVPSAEGMVTFSWQEYWTGS